MARDPKLRREIWTYIWRRPGHRFEALTERGAVADLMAATEYSGSLVALHGRLRSLRQDGLLKMTKVGKSYTVLEAVIPTRALNWQAELLVLELLANEIPRQMHATIRQLDQGLHSRRRIRVRQDQARRIRHSLTELAKQL